MNLVEMIIILLMIPLPLVYFYFRVINSPKQPPLPPGPYPWPIIGNLFQIGNNDAHIRLAKMARVHGPLMSLRFGQRTLIVGSSSAAALQILKTHDHVLSARDVSPSLSQDNEPTVYNMNLVFTPESGDIWRYLRNLYTSKLFSSKALESRVKLREDKVMEMVKYIGGKEEDIIIKDVMSVTATNILGNTLLSMDLLDFEGGGIGAGIKDYVRRLAGLGMKPPLADLFPILGRWGYEDWYKQVMHIIEKEFGSIWKDVLQMKRKNESNVNSKDFTDILIEKGFTNQQINALLEELFSAGTDSISLTTEWFIAELLRNKEVMQKAKDEVMKNTNGNNVVKESDLIHLPFIEACFKETLRLHPPAPLLLPHKATETCEIMGYTIPKDSQILVNVWAISRDPNFWDDPLKFKPERFIGSKLNYKGKDFEYLPFGGGKRMCPADAMASKTILLTVASLILRFEWFLPNMNDHGDVIDMVEELEIPMRKKEPLHVTFKLREQFKN